MKRMRCSCKLITFLLLCYWFVNAFQALSLPKFGASQTSDLTVVVHEPIVSFPWNSSLFHLTSSRPHAEEKESNIFSVEVSPSAAPDPLIPLLAPSPLNPFTPNSTAPVVSGLCAFNFSAADYVISQTAIDCWGSFAQYLGNVICCPQYEALLHILVGESSKSNGLLALNSTFAEYCFSDVQTILSSQGANASLPSICSALPSNLTEGSCPVKGVKEFEQTVNGSKLLIDCKTVDPVKECCSPVCQPAISEAARRLALKAPGLFSEDDVRMSPLQQTVVDDCHRVVLRWLSSKLTPERAKSVLRGLSNCNVNRVCPLDFPDPSEVARDCSQALKNESKCCTTLDSYISGVQQQSLITNLQALDCATSLGVMLQRKNITDNIYILCRVNLKDFSLQAFGSQDAGCLLRSLPSDAMIDKSSGVSFTCDLNDNIAAPWPHFSHSSTPSSCNKAINMPAFPAATSACNGQKGVSVVMFLFSVLSVVMLIP
ncbi:uncharacterized GPI-anchored protein At1g61900 isoform X1 [Cryptomeria japonica]|uniref:uncharacterized GPI-anchored protein At1g61900 isoform X1 n=1 Tax=Cryptomeria japonica TaxID=3369 RepID=UPI0027DAABFC|nr:uncharacterized GPI-anchored protein At1g61900 isoform X1 [Cryptomeria japonica]